MLQYYPPSGRLNPPFLLTFRGRINPRTFTSNPQNNNANPIHPHPPLLPLHSRHNHQKHPTIKRPKRSPLRSNKPRNPPRSLHLRPRLLLLTPQHPHLTLLRRPPCNPTNPTSLPPPRKIHHRTGNKRSLPRARSHGSSCRSRRVSRLPAQTSTNGATRAA